MTTLAILLGIFGAIGLVRWLHRRSISRTRPEVNCLIEQALITGGDSALG